MGCVEPRVEPSCLPKPQLCGASVLYNRSYTRNTGTVTRELTKAFSGFLNVVIGPQTLDPSKSSSKPKGMPFHVCRPVSKGTHPELALCTVCICQFGTHEAWSCSRKLGPRLRDKADVNETFSEREDVIITCSLSSTTCGHDGVEFGEDSESRGLALCF